jgi:periplasmic divalent cation tolerance protein
MTEARIVLTTAGTHAEARKLAHLLVERRLAACINIIPRIESVYRWQNVVEQAEEFLLVMKTTQDRFADLRNAIQQNHSYEVPECVALTVEDGSEKYLDWIAEMASPVKNSSSNEK